MSEKQHWYLERYLRLSEELRKAYELKEGFRGWFKQAKSIGKTDIKTVKQGLYRFYEQVAFDYSNGFIEGLNNQTKVIKRNAFGFKRYDRLRLRVLLHHQYKSIKIQVG